ncbi:MAG: 1-acyl-sn-glycerol-3-phosphate acyltransferase, partial [Candidatus Omnitrophica bacterium]|nr:1-acyl-sn-glycerol-3-phosphate acyltransferase [Candidatus Omnitrophota bacterium]
PEGSRSISQEMADFKKGAGILVKELNVPVIPVYIQGSHFSWPRGRKLPRLCPVKVIFGRMLLPDELGSDYETAVLKIRREISALSLLKEF